MAPVAPVYRLPWMFQSAQMKIFIDRTVAVPPFSGVQNAALRESEALQAAMPEDEVVQCGFGEGCALKPPFPARKAAFRILWQQTALPALLKRAGADVLFSTAYTCPLRSPVPTVLHVHDTIAIDRPELCSTLNAMHMKALMPASIRRPSTTHIPANSISDACFEDVPMKA